MLEGTADSERVEGLKKLIPSAFLDEKFDLDVFLEMLEQSGIEVVRPERYVFSWTGKSEAIEARDSPGNQILVPVIEDSIDYEKTKNLFIEGDNLVALKILRDSMPNSVKMIYIDPPYNANSGQKFYDDDFRDALRNDKADLTGTKYRRFCDENIESMETYGRRHSKWLSMIYPRISLARDLLKDEGVMFVSIDDTEVHNLRMVMNEVFGEENVEVMIWKKVDSNEGKLKLIRRFRVEHEYVLVGYKNKERSHFRKVNELPRFKNLTENVDDDPRGDWVSGNISSTEEISVKGGKNYYVVTSPGGRKFSRQWKFPRTEFDRLNRENRIYWGKDGNNVPRLKVFAKEPRSIYVSSIIEEKGTAKSAASEIAKLVGAECFPNPKPVKLIQYLIDAAETENEIILDFFAGSGTTAHAVLAQNSLDDGKRSFILVELPAPVDRFSVSTKRGRKNLSNIAEITRARIKAAIEEEQKFRMRKRVTTNSDLGMKVLRLSDR